MGGSVLVTGRGWARRRGCTGGLFTCGLSQELFIRQIKLTQAG